MEIDIIEHFWDESPYWKAKEKELEKEVTLSTIQTVLAIAGSIVLLWLSFQSGTPPIPFMVVAIIGQITLSALLFVMPAYFGWMEATEMLETFRKEREKAYNKFPNNKGGM